MQREDEDEHNDSPASCTCTADYAVGRIQIPDDKHADMRIRPPEMTIVRRPNSSTIRKAGIDMANIRIAETPGARKDAVAPGRPACAKRLGAYFEQSASITSKSSAT